MVYRITAPGKKLKGTLKLTASKSESNRALVIRSICHNSFPVHNLAEAADTATMQRLLASDGDVMDVGPAGTTMRFLTAFYACAQACGRRSAVTLTGSARMLERPIALLVDALASLGAQITYEGRQGFPPVKVIPSDLTGGTITLNGSISSQYTTALLLIAPLLEGGLTIRFTGKVISRPYLVMTLRMMEHFGARARWEGDAIVIQEGRYSPEPFTVGADWSSASYWYAMAALSEETDLAIQGLRRDSLQGDAVCAAMFEHFGVRTSFGADGIRLTKGKRSQGPFRYDFTDCPDLAQTVAVVASALGVPAELTGLQSLRIKETDRIAALRKELTQFGLKSSEIGEGTLVLSPSGLAGKRDTVVSTYEDHRMAMAFAPLAFRLPVLHIADPAVVVKSYPAFWDDLRNVAGFEVSEAV